jgi:hypothetical protein
MYMVKELNSHHKIFELLKNPEYTEEELLSILDPADNLFGSQSFISNLVSIVSTITEDRNGDKKFSIDDIILLAKDIPTILTLVNSIVLSIKLTPSVASYVRTQDMNEIIYKIFMYILLHLVPEYTGVKWSPAELEELSNITSAVYNMIVASKIAGKVVISLLKKSNICCFKSNDTQETENKLDYSNTILKGSVLNNRDKITMQKDIDVLKSQLGL